MDSAVSYVTIMEWPTYFNNLFIYLFLFFADKLISTNIISFKKWKKKKKTYFIDCDNTPKTYMGYHDDNNFHFKNLK